VSYVVNGAFRAKEYLGKNWKWEGFCDPKLFSIASSILIIILLLAMDFLLIYKGILSKLDCISVIL
jgi:hypothetical protein